MKKGTTNDSQFYYSILEELFFLKIEEYLQFLIKIAFFMKIEFNVRKFTILQQKMLSREILNYYTYQNKVFGDNE